MSDGRTVYSQLQRQVTAARQRAEADAAELRRQHDAAERLMDERSDALQRLARFYLPKLDQGDIDRGFTAVRDDLRRVHARRQQRIDELRAAIAEQQAGHAGCEAAIAEATAALERLVDQRDALHEQVAAGLRTDPGFAALAARTAEAQRALERDEERAAELQREAEDKLPSYRDSRLFMYLAERGFGTDAYRGRGMVRRIDRWVAGLIGFGMARRGYDFLRATPELVANEVARRRAEVAPLVAQVRERERQAAEAVGLPAVMAAGEDKGRERERLVGELAAAQRRLAELGSELAAVEASEGGFYAEALGHLRAFLDRAEQAVLEDKARSTPSAADDAMVAELSTLAAEVGRARARIDDLARRHAATAERVAGLERMARRFREAEYDSARSRFSDLDLDGEVHAYLDGGRSLEDTWSSIRSRQRFVAPQRADAGLGGAFGEAVAHPAARILADVMGQVVGAALRGAARRSVTRHGGFGGFGGSGGSGGGRSGGGGRFTTGRGF